MGVWGRGRHKLPEAGGPEGDPRSDCLVYVLHFLVLPLFVDCTN